MSEPTAHDKALRHAARVAGVLADYLDQLDPLDGGVSWMQRAIDQVANEDAAREPDAGDGAP